MTRNFQMDSNKWIIVSEDKQHMLSISKWLNVSNVDTVVQGQSKVEQTVDCLSSLLRAIETLFTFF